MSASSRPESWSPALISRGCSFPRNATTDYKHDLVKRVQAIPGVESAAHAMLVPFGEAPGTTTSSTKVLTRTQVWPGKIFSAQAILRPLETRLLAGRDFDDRDTPSSAKVAIVNQAFARKILKVADPLASASVFTRRREARPLYEIVE